MTYAIRDRVRKALEEHEKKKTKQNRDLAYMNALHQSPYPVPSPRVIEDDEGTGTVGRPIPYDDGKSYDLTVLVESIEQVKIKNPNSKTGGTFTSDRVVIVVHDAVKTRLVINISDSSPHSMIVNGVYKLRLKITGRTIKKQDEKDRIDAYARRVSPFTITELNETPEQIQASADALAAKDKAKRDKEAAERAEKEEAARKAAARAERRRNFPVNF